MTGSYGKTAYIRSGKRDSLLYMLFSLIIAFLFLTICSKNSFLYPMNDWGDVNCFLTTARSLLDGRVMYLDIYEQKGILVYAVYALAAMISRYGFIGVFLIELLQFSAFLYYGRRCILLYCDRLSFWGSVTAMAVLAFSLTTSIAFAHGGSVEELSLFMLSYSLFHVLKAVRASSSIKSRHSLIIGIFAGIALWSKFTILGFYIGLCSGVAIYYIRNHKNKALIKNAACFLIGLGLVTVPILVYFAKNNALAAMWEVYFYNNIFLYPGKLNYNLLTRAVSPIFNILVGTGQSIIMNGAASIFLIVWGWALWKHRKEKNDERVVTVCSFSVLAAVTFIGWKIYTTYYSLILTSFAPLGIAELIRTQSKLRAKLPRSTTGTGIAALIVLLVSAFVISGNTYLMRYKREELPQYRFAAIIRQKANASLLNYGFLDGGFYAAAEITPDYRYFCKLNIELDAMDIEQRRIIEQRQSDFVVTRDRRLEDYDLDSTGYRLTDSTVFPFEGEEKSYWLYTRVETSEH